MHQIAIKNLDMYNFPILNFFLHNSFTLQTTAKQTKKTVKVYWFLALFLQFEFVLLM